MKLFKSSRSSIKSICNEWASKTKTSLIRNKTTLESTSTIRPINSSSTETMYCFDNYAYGLGGQKQACQVNEQHHCLCTECKCNEKKQDLQN